MNYNSDLYIILPCSRNTKGAFGIADKDKRCSKDAKLFINAMSDRAKSEFDNILSSNIERCFLKEITLYIEADYSQDYIQLDSKQKGFVVITGCKSTEFCLLFVVIPNINVEYITDLLDQVSRNEIKVVIDEGEKPSPLLDYICNTKEFKLEVTGKAFYASCMTEPQKEKEKELCYILSGETRNNPYSTIKSEYVKFLTCKNHAQYEEYALFLSEFGALCIMQEFKNDYESRLETECLLLFIMELIILKITAINIANREIVKELSDSSEKKKYSLEKIKEITETFTKSIPLWDTRHFKYFNAQTEANKIEENFRVSLYFVNYEKNLKHLESIANIRNVLAAEEETKNLGLIAAIAGVLALFQLVPYIEQLIQFIFFSGKLAFPRERILSYEITLLLMLIAVLWIYKNRLIRSIKMKYGRLRQ